MVIAKEGDRSHQSEQSSITDTQHYKTSSLSRISFHRLTHGRTYRPTSRPITMSMHAPLISPTLLQYTLSNCIILFFLSFFSFPSSSNPTIAHACIAVLLPKHNSFTTLHSLYVCIYNTLFFVSIADGILLFVSSLFFVQDYFIFFQILPCPNKFDQDVMFGLNHKRENCFLATIVRTNK